MEKRVCITGGKKSGHPATGKFAQEYVIWCNV